MWLCITLQRIYNLLYLALRRNGAAKWSTDLTTSRFLWPQFKWDFMNGWCSPTRGKWQAGLIRNRLAPKRNSGNESSLAKQGILPGPWEVVGLSWLNWHFVASYLLHSGIMHFSASASCAWQGEPSEASIFIMRSLLLIPTPQLTLQGSHSPHSVTTQLLGAKTHTYMCLVISYLTLNVHKNMNTTYMYNLQQSSLTTHFSVSSVGSVQLEPSSGNCLTYLSLDLMPMPQEALHGDQLIHSDIIHVDASREQNAVIC